MSSKAHFSPQSQPGDHAVQLFDSTETRAEAVAAFVRDGLLRGEVVLIVLTEEHWDAVARRLRAAEVPVSATQASGQLVVRDAHGTMLVFRRHGVIDRHIFDRTVGALVRRLRAGGNQLRIYGEMVDLLAAEGDYRAAIQLETLWNTLATHEPFTLFCGYSASHFGNPAHAEALGTICGSHTHVRVNPRDMLGSFLVKMHAGDDAAETSIKH